MKTTSLQHYNHYIKCLTDQMADPTYDESPTVTA